MNEPAPQTRTQSQAGNKLTQMFNFIVSWKTKNDGNSPTIRDIGEFMGIDCTCAESDAYREEVAEMDVWEGEEG